MTQSYIIVFIMSNLKLSTFKMGVQEDFFPFIQPIFMDFYNLTGVQLTNYSKFIIHRKAKSKVYCI